MLTINSQFGKLIAMKANCVVGVLGVAAASCLALSSFASVETYTRATRAAREKGAAAYVQDGLVAHWDGIENVGLGLAHDGAAKVWKDLTGNRADIAIPTDAGWSDQALSFNARWKNKYLPFDGSLAASHTIEVCARLIAASANGKIIGGVVGGENFPHVLITSMFFMQPYLSGYGFGNTVGAYRFSPARGVTYTISQSGVVADGAAVYISGGCCASNIAISATNERTQAAYLGNRSDGNTGVEGYYFSVRIYNRKLADEEIVWNSVVDNVRFSELDTGCIVADNSANPHAVAYSDEVLNVSPHEFDWMAAEGIDFSSKPTGAVIIVR